MTQKIPRFLCDKYGDKPTREFKMFEMEFDFMCELYSVPKKQKVKRLLVHLEGSVQIHAASWVGAQGTRAYSYKEVMDELRETFQKPVWEDEAEIKLIGRKWNIFEQDIREFVHDTRVLVQQAYPAEPNQWDKCIKTSIRLALPIELVRHVISQGAISVAEIEKWIRTHTQHVERDEEPTEHAEAWVKRAYRTSQARKNKKTTTQEKGTLIEGVMKTARKS